MITIKLTIAIIVVAMSWHILTELQQRLKQYGRGDVTFGEAMMYLVKSDLCWPCIAIGVVTTTFLCESLAYISEHGFC